MVPVTPLSLAKEIVVRAIEAAGSQRTVAKHIGVSPARVAQWADPDHEALPNLGHMMAMASFGQVLADGVAEHHRDVAPIVALGEVGLRREFIRLNTCTNDLILAADEAIVSGDKAALADVQAKMLRLADHVRRISRALASMGGGR